MKKIIIAILFFTFAVLHANELGIVQKANGNVKVKHEKSIKKKKIKAGYKIQVGDIISTLRNSDAVLKLNDGSIVVLAEKSSVYFPSKQNFEQKEG